MSWTGILFYLALCALPCLYWGFAVEKKRLYRETHGLEIPGLPKAWEGRRILFFSDLHLGKGMPPERLEAFIKTMTKEEPDLILFGGDLSENAWKAKESTKEAWTQSLKTLQAPLGIYAVNGNHDSVTPKDKEFFDALTKQLGWTVLENDGLMLEGLYLSGLVEDMNGWPDLEKAEEKMDGQPFEIILFHQPDPVQGFQPSGSPALFLSGHSHNGQIRPFGLHLYKEEEGRELVRGPYVLNKNSYSLVSGGLGTVKIHARFAAPPEYQILELHQANSEKNSRFFSASSRTRRL